MNLDFFNNIEPNYDRTIYNLFINSSEKEKNSKNREFSSMDMFPTTLASIGVKIEGNKLGLGTNLYSGEKTILEKYGINYVDEEFKKNSTFYNDKIAK